MSVENSAAELEVIMSEHDSGNSVREESDRQVATPVNVQA